MRRFKQITGIVLVAMMALSAAGCGKQTETVEDYGSTAGGSVASGEDAEKDELEEILGEYETDSQGIILGECKDEFQAGTTKVMRDIKEHGECHMDVPIIKAERTTPQNLDAEGYAKKLFGDTARQLSYKPRNPDNLRDWDVELGTEFEFSEEDYWDEKDAKEDTWFAYEGKYNENEYYLLVTYESESGIAGLEMFPKNAGDIIGEGRLSYVTQYDPAYFEIPDVYSPGAQIVFPEHHGYMQEDGEILHMDKETGPEFDIKTNMKDSPNRCTFTDEQLVNHAKDFFEGTLGINISEYAMSSRCSNRFYELYTNIELSDAEAEEDDGNTDEVKKADRVELVFSERNSFPDIDYTSSVRDGYKVSVLTFINGLIVPMSYTDFRNEFGYVNITDSGIVGFKFRWRYLVKERLSDESVLMSFENIMQCMEKALIDSEVLANMTMPNIQFDYMSINYKEVESPDDPDEITLVPALSFDGSVYGNPVYEITLNAIDGSVIEEREVSY